MISREREREQNRRKRSPKCPKCSKPTNSEGKCYNRNCENYHRKKNLLSKIRKGDCVECERNNVWIITGDYYRGDWCFECKIVYARMELQQFISEGGLKNTQMLWKNMKPQIEKWIKELESKDSQAGKFTRKLFQTLENDLFPEKRRRRNWLIAGGIIAGIAVIITIFYFVFKKREARKTKKA